MEFYRKMVKEKWPHFYELAKEINEKVELKKVEDKDGEDTVEDTEEKGINWRYLAEELGEIYLAGGIPMKEWNKLRLNYDRYGIRKNDRIKNHIFKMGKVQSPMIAFEGNLEEINKTDHKMEGNEVELFASWCVEMRFDELYKIAELLDKENAVKGKVSAEEHKKKIDDEKEKTKEMFRQMREENGEK